MAKGRRISNSISADRRVEQLSDQSALLFTWAFAHGDAEGRLLGDPDAVRGLVAPRRAWTADDVAAFMAEWTQTTDEKSGLLRPLALIYIVADGRVVIEFAGWEKNQSLRRRERRSGLPPPCDAVAQWVSESLSHSVSDSPPAHLRARARGTGSQPRESSRGGTNKPRETDGVIPEPILWLSAEAERVFGRPLRQPRPSKFAAVIQALNASGRELASRRMREVAADGYEPTSLTYFVPVLHRAVEDAQTGSTSLAVGDLIDLAARLEARGA